MTNEKGNKAKKASLIADQKYNQWKSLVPVLYDWHMNHHLDWPSLSCRWGPLLEEGISKNDQCIYLSQRTNRSASNTLIFANVEVVKMRTASIEHVSEFNEEEPSPHVSIYKTIIHPGEVNTIRELPSNSNIVATHTDSPAVLIWDVEAQPDREAFRGAEDSLPNLMLAGHQQNAEFALSMCPTEPLVLSGGKDKLVLLWSIQDHVSTLGEASLSTVRPRGVFQGHRNTVEDVQFCPNSTEEFCSVGDDSRLILWDARVGTSPALKVERAHNDDIHSVDWNLYDVNHILTGSADSSVHMFDRRNLTSGGIGSPVHKFEGHEAAILCLQWAPHKASVFGSAAEDGFLNIWDHEKIGQNKLECARLNMPSAPSGLLFQHRGNRGKVVDFHWNPCDPWTVASVSDECSIGGGGTLQVWRMMDLLYRPKEEVLEELESLKSQIFNGKGKSPSTS